MGQLAEFASNHPFLVMGLLATWGAVMFYELRLKSLGLVQVSVPDAVKLINRGAMVVDVREPDAFRNGHIVNAKNIPLAKITDDKGPLKKQKNKVVLAVCDNGAVSRRAVQTLRGAGHEKTFSIKGGLAGWRAENQPLVK
jgi:rhodanese-related sulfurtransferase